MGVLTWPADQSCGRHRTLQLGGGGEGVGDAPHSTVGQLALGALGAGGGWAELDVRRAHWRVSSFKGGAATNLLDGVMLNDAGALAGLVVVLQGRSSGLRLLQLLRHELLRFERRGRGATVGDRRGRLLVNALLDFLLLLQRFDECTFQPIGVLGFQSLFLVGRHALFTEDGSAFCLVLPPAASKVSVALATHKRLFDDGLGGRDARLSCIEKEREGARGLHVHVKIERKCLYGGQRRNLQSKTPSC